MPQYEIDFADGSVATVEAPEGASEQEILSAYYGGGEGSGLSELTRRRAIRETGPLGQFVRGLGAGALNVAELATLGALAPLGEDLEAPARESVSSFFEGLQPELLAGEGEGSTAQRVAGGLGQAFGSFAPIAVTGGLAGLPAAAAVGVAAGAGEASERAREFGLDGVEAGRQAIKGAFVGATEFLPVARLLRGVDKIADNLPRGWKEQAREALITGGEEAAQEVVAGALQNAIESGYNPEQDILETGLAEEGGYGFAVGATLEGLVQLAAGRRFRQRVRADEEAARGEEVPGTDVVGAPPLLEPPSGTQGELFSAEEMGLRAVEPDQEPLQLEDLRPDDRQQDMFARIEDQMADEISAAPFERTEAIEPTPFERTDDVDRDSPMAQAMRTAQRRQAFEQIEAEQAAQREADLDRLQNIARAEREVEAAPELRPAEPPMAREPAPLEEPVQESLPGLGRPYQRGVAEEPAPEPRVVTREELRGIGLAGGSRLVKRIAGKPFESEEVQEEIANFVGNMNVSPEQRTAVRRWANETAAEQQDLFAEPISERARRRQEAEARRRDRPVEPPASERREQAPRGLTEEELAIPEVTEEAAPETALALFSETAIQDAERQNPKSRELLVEMPITEFLSLAKGMEARDVGKTKTVKDVIDAGGQFDSVPLLKFEANRDGEAAVTGHEGRHRALALQDLGYTTLPVRLISSEGGGVSIRWGGQTNPKSYDYVQTYPETLTNEDGDTTVPFPVPRDAYAKQVTERWQPLQEPTADAGQPQQTKAAPEPEAAAPTIEIIGQPPRTKAMQKFLEKERGRVVAVGVEEDGVRIYTRSDTDPADDGSGTFFGASETAAIKDFYARVQPRQQAEAAPEAQPEPEPAPESEQEAPPASERREQAPRELTEEELAIPEVAPEQIRVVDMEEAFRQAQPPKQADQVNRAETISEAVARASGRRAEDNMFIRAKRGFEALRRALVQGQPYAGLESKYSGPNPLTAGDYNVLGDLLSREGNPTKERQAAQRYFARYPSPVDALRALVHEDVFGTERFKKATDRTSKALGQLAEVSGATPEADVAFFSQMGGDYTQAALDWVNNQLSQEVRAWMAQEAFRQRAALAKYEQRSSKDLIKEIRANEQRIRKQEEALEEQLAREAKTSGNVLKNSKQATDLFRKQNPNSEVMQPLSPAVEVAFELDGVSAGLYTLANSLKSKPLRKIAMRLSSALRNSGTQIRVVNMASLLQERPALRDPEDPTRVDPGMFVLEENTIYLDAATGLDALNFMHEATHAATAYFMRSNPSMPAVRQINKLYETIKPNLDGYYAAESVDEFVAEVYANPDFRSKLARLNLDGTEMTAWQRFVNAIKSMFGFDGSALGQAQEAVDQIVAGSEMVGDPGVLWMASTKGNGGEVLKNAYRAMPESTQQAVESLRANLSDPTIPEAAKEAVRFVQDLNTVKRTAGAKFPMYAELEDILRRQAAYAQELLGYLQGTVRDANKWVKSVQNETMNVLGKQVSKKAGLSYLLSTSTRTETDMSRPRSYYEKAVADAEANLPSATAGSYISRLEAVEKAKERLAAYDVMAPWYQEIGPKGQETYKRSLNMFKRYKGELIDVLKAKLARIPDSAVRNRLTKELVEKLENHGIDPYYPLVRNGRYWITYSANDPITGRNDTFITSFHTYKEREQAIRELEAQRDNIGLKGEVDKYDKLEVSNFRNAPPESFIGNVQKILEEAGVDADVQASVLELYVDLLPERSFAKGLMHREGKRGSASDITPLTDITPQHDFIETLEQSGQRFTKQLATAKYVGEMADVENKAEEFAKGDANKADPAVQGYYRDFQNRVGFARRPDVSNVSRAITSGLYLFTMGFSPASAALQLSTLPLVTYPMLGGKYGYRESASQISRSTALLKAAGNMRQIERAGVNAVTETARESFRFIRSFGNYDLDAAKPEGMSDAEYANLQVFVDTLSRYNELGHTVNADLLDLQGTKSNMWGRVQQLGGFLNHSAELASRQVSGHAYYELELAKIPNPTDADRVRVAKEAIEFMSETNSSTLSGGVAPMSQNDWLRVLAMFKRWPVSMLQLQLEVMKDAFAGETPEAKRIARMQLAGMYGTAGLLAGATGAPLYGVMQMVFDALRDDDEEDFDTLVRTYMGEAFAKGIINYGLGVDVATRMAMTNFVFREPLIEQDSTLMNLLVMFGGPAIGVMNNADRVADLWSRGEIERGFEALLPIAAKNILRSGRFAMEGARTLNGDPIVEDIHPLHIAAQVFGLAPAEYIRQLEQNAALLGIDRAINEKRTELLQKRNIAVRDGRSTEDIDREIAEFNRRQPQAVIDGDTIRRSQQAYRRTAERRREGAVFSELNDERMRIMAEAWGDATLFD